MRKMSCAMLSRMTFRTQGVFELRHCALLVPYLTVHICSIETDHNCLTGPSGNKSNVEGDQNQDLKIRQYHSDANGHEVDKPSIPTSPAVSKTLSKCAPILSPFSASSVDAPSSTNATEETVGDLSVPAKNGSASKQNQDSLSDKQSGQELVFNAEKNISTTSVEFDERYVVSKRR